MGCGHVATVWRKPSCSREECVVSLLSHARLSVTPWTVALQVSLSIEILQARISGVGCHTLLQEFFPTQRSNPGVLHCRWIFLQTESPGKPKNIGECSLTLLQGIFPTQELNQGLLHYRQILYQLSYKTVQKRAQRGEERREKWYYLGL